MMITMIKHLSFCIQNSLVLSEKWKTLVLVVAERKGFVGHRSQETCVFISSWVARFLCDLATPPYLRFPFFMLHNNYLGEARLILCSQKLFPTLYSHGARKVWSFLYWLNEFRSNGRGILACAAQGVCRSLFQWHLGACFWRSVVFLALWGATEIQSWEEVSKLPCSSGRWMKEIVPRPLKLTVSFTSRVSFLGSYQHTLLSFSGDRGTYYLYALFSLSPLKCILMDNVLLSMSSCWN